MVIQMRSNYSLRTVMVLLVLALLCGVVHAAGIGIVAETHETSGAGAPVCTAPCECISETAAIAKWGTTGYDKCSKTVCGQSADAMVQYYCFYQVGGAAPAATMAPAQVAAPAAAAPAAAAPAAGVTQKSPVNAATILAAIGAALLAAAGMRRR
jgi:hypothetical protein